MCVCVRARVCKRARARVHVRVRRKTTWAQGRTCPRVHNASDRLLAVPRFASCNCTPRSIAGRKDKRLLDTAETHEHTSSLSSGAVVVGHVEGVEGRSRGRGRGCEASVLFWHTMISRSSQTFLSRPKTTGERASDRKAHGLDTPDPPLWLTHSSLLLAHSHIIPFPHSANSMTTPTCEPAVCKKSNIPPPPSRLFLLSSSSLSFYSTHLALYFLTHVRCWVHSST